jgi:hypothetical protein
MAWLKDILSYSQAIVIIGSSYAVVVGVHFLLDLLSKIVANTIA